MGKRHRIAIWAILVLLFPLQTAAEATESEGADGRDAAAPYDFFNEDESPAALDGNSATGIKVRTPPCPQAYMNKETGCVTPRKMACLDAAFPRTNWLALNRNAVSKATSNMTQRSEHMRQGQWISGQDIPPEIARLLPETDIFAGLPDGPPGRCALVSSGPALLGSGLGDRIDSHHLVMRLNNAPVRGFERDVGRRTTLRLTAMPFSGYRETDSETVVALWCPDGRKCGHKQELRTLLDKKVLPLNPLFWKYANGVQFRKRGVEASTGMVALALLLHGCERVTAFGFAGEDAKTWYYPKRQSGGKYQPLPQSQWLSNKEWHVDEWPPLQPKLRGATKRARAAKGAGATLAHRTLVRHLMGSLDYERTCFEALAAKGVITSVTDVVVTGQSRASDGRRGSGGGGAGAGLATRASNDGGGGARGQSAGQMEGVGERRRRQDDSGGRSRQGALAGAVKGSDDPPQRQQSSQRGRVQQRRARGGGEEARQKQIDSDSVGRSGGGEQRVAAQTEGTGGTPFAARGEGQQQKQQQEQQQEQQKQVGGVARPSEADNSVTVEQRMEEAVERRVAEVEPAGAQQQARETQQGPGQQEQQGQQAQQVAEAVEADEQAVFVPDLFGNQMDVHVNEDDALAAGGEAVFGR